MITWSPALDCQEFEQFYVVTNVEQARVLVREHRLKRISERRELSRIVIHDLNLATSTLKGKLWTGGTDFERELLSAGAAHLFDIRTAPRDYVDAQYSAARQGKGIWRDIAFLDRFGYTTLAEARRHEAEEQRVREESERKERRERRKAEALKLYAEQNALREKEREERQEAWSWILAVASVLGSLYAIIKLRRKHDVLILGASGTGKSVFFDRIDSAAPMEEGETEPTRKPRQKEKVLRASDGRRVFRVRIFDFGGQYPWHVLDELTSRKFLGGRRRFVIVVVLSAFKLEERDTPIKISEAFIGEQLGWVSGLVAGFLKSKLGSRRCRGVLFYINMLDLFEKVAGGGDAVGYRKAFAEHLQRIEATGVKPALIVGSALMALNTREARSWIFQTITGEVTA